MNMFLTNVIFFVCGLHVPTMLMHSINNQCLHSFTQYHHYKIIDTDSIHKHTTKETAAHDTVKSAVISRDRPNLFLLLPHQEKFHPKLADGESHHAYIGWKTSSSPKTKTYFSPIKIRCYNGSIQTKREQNIIQIHYTVSYEWIKCDLIMPYQWHRLFGIKWFESIAMFGKHKNTELAIANYSLPTCRQWGVSWQTSEGIALFSRWNPKWALPIQARSIAIWINFLGNVFRTDTHTGMHIHFMHLLQTQINAVFTIYDR